MNEITVKSATFSDVDIIKSIYEDARLYGKISGSCDWSEDYPNDEIINDDIDNKTISIVYSNDEPIAVFSLIDHDDLDYEPLPWIQIKSGVPVRICIKSQYQGKGLGKVVMKELIKIAIDKGYKSLRLLASTSNIPANNLYRGIGFVHKGVVNLYHKDFNAYELIL